MKNLLEKVGKFFLLIPLIFSLQTREVFSQKENPEDSRYVVVIDPGHGWENKEPGVMDWGEASYKKYKESDIVLQQAKIIEKLADSTKYKIILTRYDNETSMPIEQRQKIAKNVGADLFISLHLNNYRKSYVRGFEVFYRHPECEKVAELAVKNLEAKLNTRNRGVKRGMKLVLKDASCPAILIESGFPKNQYDIIYLTDNIPDVEEAVLVTIDDYFELYPINPFLKPIKSITISQIENNFTSDTD